MRRCVLFSLPLVALGCQGEESATSRVVLPSGLERPKGLSPDAPSTPPLTRPATEIERSPPLVPPVQGPTVAATAGSLSTPGVEGVCRYDESEVACWDRHGVADAKLTTTIRAALASQMGGTTLPVTVGRKGRIAVVLTPKPPSDSVVWNAEAIHPAQAPPSVSLQVGPDGRSRSLVLLSEDLRATTSGVRFTERKRLSREVPIALKPGASASLGGCRLIVSKVEKLGAEDEDRFFAQNRPSWRVVILRSGEPPRPEEFFAVDPYPVYFNDGRRGSFGPSGKGKTTFAPKDEARISFIGYSELPKGAVAVLIDRDPAKVKRLILGGNEVRTVTLDGIPLDPKP